jgi:transposase InsO family protein
MNLRHQIQRIALRWPAYGYRRVHAELLRQGWSVNHKRILRLMRADNLLCLRQRKFLLTTDSQHGLPIYPNVAEEMVLTGIDQLWVADITYIRLQVEFVYLAVLLDAFSRRCLGWALRRSLEAALVLEALRMALMRRHPWPGLVHHSDRGVQYASRDYTALLEQHGIRISMSRLATPYDNAQAESFIKTLKYFSGRSCQPNQRQRVLVQCSQEWEGIFQCESKQRCRDLVHLLKWRSRGAL